MKSLLIGFAISLATACKDSNPAPDLPDASRADSASDAGENVCVLETGTPPNCFDLGACEPSTTEDILNSCSDVGCIAFDNVARLPRYNNGNLPALP